MRIFTLVIKKKAQYFPYQVSVSKLSCNSHEKGLDIIQTEGEKLKGLSVVYKEKVMKK